ncbi:YfjL-like protein [Anaeromicrobium sediminis]|uniref:Uncharacterized protein n=1 Tax=Anaeromicrobium sediminis TaxID=1478221 RepID=A0A267MRK5_9FIRM|nr:hypothetical protein [Anaeromicrobium sediminis]PAB61403.1 hypothetical protein CCE28_02965 [Anaeromicrobium sediminis]
MKKMKLSMKIITTTVITVIVVVICFILVIMDAYNGNPISKGIATGKINDYVKTTYEEYELIVGETRYSFDYGNYWSYVYSKKDIDMHFNVMYKHGKIYDNFEFQVLSGQNTCLRMEKEYTLFISSLLKKEYPYTYKNAAVQYVEMDYEKKFDGKLNKPLDINDAKYMKVSLFLNNVDGSVESLASNLKKLHLILTKNGYYFDEYDLVIESYIRVSSIKSNMIDEKLVELIQYALDNREEAIEKYGFWVNK